MKDNPYENLFETSDNKENVNSDANVPTEEPVLSDFMVSNEDKSDVSQADKQEYSVVYSDGNVSFNKENTEVPLPQSDVVSDDSNNKDASAESGVSTCEWYGGNVVSDIPKPPVSSAPYQAPVSDIEPVKVNNENKGRRTPTAVLLILCILISMVSGGIGGYLVGSKEDNNSSSGSGLTINQISPEYSENSDVSTSDLSTVDIVDKTADSVVEIITEYVQTGVFSQQYIQSGAGSGVIIDSTGYIVTNHHVIENAQKITVTLRSGESFDAQLIGSDAQMDLALLKIEAENLTSAVFGNSDTLKVGQKTVAIGNPLGQLGGTVTEGVLSALDRDVVVDDQSMRLLQTDTAINPGNSGGGLFDGQGNLIGIVVAKSSGSEVEGLGFAIPVNDAIDVISDLMEYGYVRGRVDVGMEFLDVSSIQVAWMYGLSELGCYVYSVDENSNAADAGFKSGDLVLSVDGTEVDSTEDIESLLKDKAVGDEVIFIIKRGNSKGDVTLVLEEYKPDVVVTPGDDGDDSIIWH